MSREEIAEYYPDLMCIDGHDYAIIGVAERINMEPVVAYDEEKIIETLMDRDNMTYEEAVEFFDFNIKGAWVGETTPIFITRNL